MFVGMKHEFRCQSLRLESMPVISADGSVSKTENSIFHQIAASGSHGNFLSNSGEINTLFYCSGGLL